MPARTTPTIPATAQQKRTWCSEPKRSPHSGHSRRGAGRRQPQRRFDLPKMIPLVRTMPSIVAVALAGCVSSGESHWVSSSVINVHWEQYEFVDPVCRKRHPPEPNDSDPPQFMTGCARVVGHDCYIYTDTGRTDLVGGLIEGCFELFQTRTKIGDTSR